MIGKLVGAAVSYIVLEVYKAQDEYTAKMQPVWNARMAQRAARDADAPVPVCDVIKGKSTARKTRKV